MEGVVMKEMKEIPQIRLAKGPSIAKLSTGDVGNNQKINRNWRAHPAAASLRTGYMHRGSPRQGSRLIRGLRSDMVIFGDRFRRREAKKEILRRALTPPAKRPTLRWLDFRPTPSRLCNMSMV